ncbi:Trm112 family protein [Luteococcus peritonei]|uniref:UPF0434 protein ACFSCS_11265 n=1 Tax=Luteococcus peritonei TaxID=88874 RepID=A0ABW4RWV2_9ACTN
MPDQMELSATFLEIAACPSCHSKFAVDYDRHELECTNSACALAFPVRDGIPVLLVDEARRPGATGAGAEA